MATFRDPRFVLKFPSQSFPPAFCLLHLRGRKDYSFQIAVLEGGAHSFTLEMFIAGQLCGGALCQIEICKCQKR